MHKTIIKLVVTVAAVAASFVAIASPAAAGGYGHHHPGPGYGGHHGRPHGPPHWRPLPPPVCQPMHAVDKARWNGLRRAHIEYVSRNRVVVAGYRHYGYDRMVFANRVGCPLIRR